MQKKVDDNPTDNVESYQISDPQELAHNMLRLMEKGGIALSGLLAKSGNQGGSMSSSNEMSEATELLAEIAKQWMNNPDAFAEVQGDLMRDYSELMAASVKRMMGQEVDPVAEPEAGDARFKDHDWSDNQYFDFWKQAYLITSRWAEDVVLKTDGLDDQTRQRAGFHLQQLTTALSPSNFPVTNPEVLRETLNSNASNLVKGMENLATDVEKSDDLLKISQTDVSAFEVGVNVAATEGKVVFENEIIQLIQYTPTTDTVHEKPLLIVPPWINKFYILDLAPAKSFIRYAVAEGFTVFIISWVNPDERLRDKTFEDYMFEGLLTAADAVKAETNQETVNAVGYCVGGTLLASSLGWLAARNENVFESATFFTTQVDFTKAGDLQVFIDDAQLTELEEMMAERGYLDGSRMANAFNMLRPRDLIWPYIVNNYMLGKQPFPFDLLFWNQDSTRMTEANHSFYLREFYNDNKLSKGELSLGGEKLDLGKVTLPIYELAAREDHIAPAQSVFVGSKLFGGPVRYVLSGSGHIAGVVNPPEKHKYQYWINTRDEDTYEEWFENSTEHPGSWWPDWSEWLSSHSGDFIDARTPGDILGTIEDAPGSYVKVKA